MNATRPETVLVRRVGAGQTAPQPISAAAQALPVVGGVGGSLLGALTGAIIGMVTGHIAVGVGVGLVGGGAMGYYVGKKIEDDVGTAVAAPGGGTPGGGTSTTTGTVIQPGAMALAENPGSHFTLLLPTGASWAPQVVNVNGTAPTSGNAPFVATAPATGSTTLSMNWTDASGAAQTTVLTVNGVSQFSPPGGFQVKQPRVALDPSSLQQTLTIGAGYTFAIDLPSGATWATQLPQTAAAGVPSSGNASAQVKTSLSESLVIAWNDVNAGAVKTTLTITVQ